MDLPWMYEDTEATVWLRRVLSPQESRPLAPAPNFCYLLSGQQGSVEPSEDQTASPLYLQPTKRTLRDILQVNSFTQHTHTQTFSADWDNLSLAGWFKSFFFLFQSGTETCRCTFIATVLYKRMQVLLSLLSHHKRSSFNWTSVKEQRKHSALWSSAVFLLRSFEPALISSDVDGSVHIAQSVTVCARSCCSSPLIGETFKLWPRWDKSSDQSGGLWTADTQIFNFLVLLHSLSCIACWVIHVFRQFLDRSDKFHLIPVLSAFVLSCFL